MTWISWLLLFVLALGGCATKPEPSAEQHGPQRIRDVPPDTVFYLNDHQGSPVVVTNARGEVVHETTRHPYGSVRSERGSVDDPFSYVGNERDPGSGLHDFRARPYRPSAGVFLAPDPVAVFSPEQVLDEPGRLSAYGYGSGDSINRSDPDGELWQAIVLGVAAAAGITFASEYANAPTLVDPSTKHRGTAGLAIEAAAIAITVHGVATAGPGLIQGAFNFAKRAVSGAAAKVSARWAGRGLGDATTSPALADPRVGVSSHIEQFRDGASYLLPRSRYLEFVKGRSTIGRPGGQFVTTRKAMDRLIRGANGDLGMVKEQLGIPKNEWNEPLMRVDVHDPLLHNARLPSGLENGANPNFRYGGYTSGGMPEAVIGQVPAGGFSVSSTNVAP